MTIDERDYMQPADSRVRAREHFKRVARLRKATRRANQLALFPTRWTRIRDAASRAIRSEWFNVFVFLLMVLTAVLWSATRAI